MREHTLKNGVKMAVVTTALRDQCAVRFREALLQEIPAMVRKRVSSLLGTSPETVDGWIDHEAPQIPSTKHLLAAFAVFGPGFTAHVLAPCGAWVRVLSVEARLDRLRREIDDLKREIDEFEMDAPPDLVSEVRVALAASEAALERARKKD